MPQTVIYLSEKINLNIISRNTQNFVINKFKLYNFLKNDFLIPDYLKLGNKSRLKNFLEKNKKPYITKPIDGRGSREVQYFENKKNLLSFLSKLKKNKLKKTIIQKFVMGKQYSTESLYLNGKMKTIISLRNYRTSKKYLPNIIENGGDLSPSISPKLKKKIDLFLEKLRFKLKIFYGPMKCDLIILNNTIYLLEAAIRFGGGFVASKCSHHIFNENFIEAYYNFLTGDKNTKYYSKKFYSVSCRAIIQKKKDYGFFEKIEIKNLKKFKKNILCLSINKKPGEIISKPMSHADRVGFIVIGSKTKSYTSRQLADKIVSSIEIKKSLVQ